MLPVRVKDRLVTVIYARHAERPPGAGLQLELEPLQRVAAATAAALRALYPQRKQDAKS